MYTAHTLTEVPKEMYKPDPDQSFRNQTSWSILILLHQQMEEPKSSHSVIQEGFQCKRKATGNNPKK